MEEINPQRGTKRKRYEPTPQPMSAKIAGKLHHDLKEVKKAAKKAKAFETQKLVKKLKDIRKKSEASEEITEVERQLKLLKELDHEVVATTALRTKLNKHRILTENEDVLAAISKELVTNIITATPGSDAAKMQSKLLSSKILASEIATVVDGLKYIIQPPNSSVELFAEDEAAFERPQKLKKVVKVKNPILGNSTTTYHAPLEATEVQDELEKGLDVDSTGWESGTVDEEEIEESIGWESGSASENEDDESSNGLNDDDELAIPLPSPQKTKQRKESTQASKKSTGMHSTFLPSLSVGFMRGDSDDSDLSESEIKVGDINIKKNRRGQRARRAIWEKKFGKNANHKKKEARAMVLDPNGSKRRNADNKIVPYHLRKVDAGWSQHTSSTAGPQNPIVAGNPMKRRVEEKAMHPSWEAKRKLKEKESVGILPSQGTKIKF